MALALTLACIVLCVGCVAFALGDGAPAPAQAPEVVRPRLSAAEQDALAAHTTELAFWLEVAQVPRGYLRLPAADARGEALRQ